MKLARLLVVTIPLSLACSSSSVESSELQLGSPHVRIGFGVTTFSDDALHLDDPAGFATVTKYLEHLHGDHVHVRVPWCRLEPKAGVFPSVTYLRLREWVQLAHQYGQDTLVSIDTRAPYFARRDALKHDDQGHYFAGSGCESAPTGNFPDGDPAPAFSSEAIDHFGQATSALLACLRGDQGNPGGCPTGNDLLPHVLLEIGDETNWGANWQTGQCESGKDWYAAGVSSDGKSCKDGNGDVGRIDPMDADLYGELANHAAKVAHQEFQFTRVSLGGIFMHSGDWGSNHPDGTTYLRRVYERADHPNLWDHDGGTAWDKVALHFGGGCGDPHTTQWDGCSGSVKSGIEDVRGLLRDQDPDGGKAIWITGLLDDGAGGEQAQSNRYQEIWKGIVASFCTTSHPVTMVKFSRLPDPGTGDLPDIGFFKAGDAQSTDPKTWTPKQDYKDMDTVLAKNCP